MKSILFDIKEQFTIGKLKYKQNEEWILYNRGPHKRDFIVLNHMQFMQMSFHIQTDK